MRKVSEKKKGIIYLFTSLFIPRGSQLCHQKFTKQILCILTYLPFLFLFFSFFFFYYYCIYFAISTVNTYEMEGIYITKTKNTNLLYSKVLSSLMLLLFYLFRHISIVPNLQRLVSELGCRNKCRHHTQLSEEM